MIIDGLVPERVITLLAAATIFLVMFTLGLGIVPREFRGVAYLVVSALTLVPYVMFRARDSAGRRGARSVRRA